MTDTDFCATTSVKGKRWALRPAAEFSTPEGIPKMAAALAAARGFDLETFFSPTLKACMPDPFVLKDMDVAVRRFCDAVQSGKRIALYGDYDVDGATSTSLVLRWLTAMGIDAAFYIPDRLKEGYGPNADAIRRLQTEEGIEFLLVLDSGTTAHGPLGVAAELGMEIVIIDHHEPDDKSPPGTLVNPKRKDEDRSLAHLCTAGLAFLFLVGVQREMRQRDFFNDARPQVDLRRWLGIVALGTIADVVPLIGLNRAYVATGLPRMGDVPGLAALAVATGESAYTTQTCGFVFGPCINATGRIGDTRLGTMLLATDDAETVRQLARELVETNVARREIQGGFLEAAIADARGRAGDPVMVLYYPDCHPGVVGLVASRVKDAVDKPAIVIGSGGTASCRSVEGFDIGHAVIAAREAGILVKGGGHGMAAGLTVTEDRIEDLRAFMAKEAEGFEHPPLTVDVAIPCGEINPASVSALESLQPFGTGNLRPKVAVTGGWVKRCMVLKEKHVKLVLTSSAGETEAMMWNAIGTPLGDALVGCEDMHVDVLGTPRIDEYGGRRRAVISIEDVMITNDLLDLESPGFDDEDIAA